MGNTANLSLPYPENTDPLANMAAAIQALAAAIDGGGIGGAWVAWSPTLTGISLGNGVVIARRLLMGKTVHFRFQITLGSTTTFSAANSFSLPSAAQAIRWRFDGEILDAGFANYPIQGRVNPVSPSVVELVYRNGAGNTDASVTNAAPFGIGSGDVLTMSGTYERT